MVAKVFILLLIATATIGEETRLLLDLAPNEAQELIEKQDLSLKYAPKIDSNVPALRYLGNEQHEVLEDIYLANQFHGQDGLGGYVYGYGVPDIAKSEKKQAGGEVRGQYSYVNGDGQEIKVEYWDDGTGFHQTDNLPKVELTPVEDTPEVKAAKEEHLRLWNELAQKDKNYNPNVEQESPQQQEEADNYNKQWDGPEYVPTKEELESPKDPKGFFYSFDYPVGIIVDKGKAVPKSSQSKRNAENLFQQTRSILNGPQKRVRRNIQQWSPYRIYLRNY